MGSKTVGWAVALLLIAVYSLTAPSNHTEAEDVYHFAKVVEQGGFAEQAGVNRVLALPSFGVVYKVTQSLGYSGRAFPFMIFINRLLAVAALALFPCLLQCLKPKVQRLSFLFLAFSYGFWRYANEAETYMLALVLALGAWCLAIKGRWVWCLGVSALGVLVHLLNLIPLLLVIPLYYLLSKEWKKGLLHGGITGGLVLLGYMLCSPWLDWGELGAQHHSAEAGLGFDNLLRAGIGFGQCLVSGNFLFGFEGFRELLAQLFPSRMLGEEFYMAEQMPGWISVVGCFSIGALGLGLLGQAIGVGRWVFGGRNVDDASCFVAEEQKPNTRHLKSKAFFISCTVWLGLYAVSVIRTEAGSPELWIMALIPFWLVVAPFLKRRFAMVLVVALFGHNLVAGLLPVMPKETDYHAAKGRWLVENSTADDLILTSYEPVMIFYLDYFAAAKVVNSGSVSLEEIQRGLESRSGEVYALSTFFKPLESMQVRSPVLYEQMWSTGELLRPEFGKIVENEFGGIYAMKETGDENE